MYGLQLSKLFTYPNTFILSRGSTVQSIMYRCVYSTDTGVLFIFYFMLFQTANVNTQTEHETDDHGSEVPHKVIQSF